MSHEGVMGFLGDRGERLALSESPKPAEQSTKRIFDMREICTRFPRPHHRISNPLLRFTINSSTSMQRNINAESAYIVGSTPRLAAEYTTMARF